MATAGRSKRWVGNFALLANEFDRLKPRRCGKRGTRRGSDSSKASWKRLRRRCRPNPAGGRAALSIEQRFSWKFMNRRNWATQLIETDRLPLKRSGALTR